MPGCQAWGPDPEHEDSDDYGGERMTWKHLDKDGASSTARVCDEGLSHSTAEGRATLERSERKLSVCEQPV